MTNSFLEFLGQLSGYKQKYGRCHNNFLQCQLTLSKITVEYNRALETIRQLELLVPCPAPPQIDYIVERDSAWVETQLQTMELQIVRLPLDGLYKLTNRKNFANIIVWDTTDLLMYVRHLFDCEDFAMLFKVLASLYFRVNQVVCVIDYKSGHAYNLILFTESEHMILEPQSDGMYLWTKRLTGFYSLKGAFALI